MTPNDILQDLAPLSSERLHPAEDGNNTTVREYAE